MLYKNINELLRTTKVKPITVLLCALCHGKCKTVGLFLTVWLLERRKIHEVSFFCGNSLWFLQGTHQSCFFHSNPTYVVAFTVPNSMPWGQHCLTWFYSYNMYLRSLVTLVYLYTYTYTAMIIVWNLFWWHKWRRWGSGHVMWASVLWTMLERVSTDTIDLYNSFWARSDNYCWKHSPFQNEAI